MGLRDITATKGIDASKSTEKMRLSQIKSNNQRRKYLISNKKPKNPHHRIIYIMYKCYEVKIKGSVESLSKVNLLLLWRTSSTNE